MSECRLREWQRGALRFALPLAPRPASVSLHGHARSPIVRASAITRSSHRWTRSCSPPSTPSMSAEWFIAAGTLVLAAGTLVLAAVAIFQDTVRGWFYHPTFEASIQTKPPDCTAVQVSRLDGTKVADSVYLRLRVKNIGKATAKNAEVYASELLRRRTDGTWERVDEFPPMNLKWSNSGGIYWPFIVAGMGKHCDIGHIVDPACRPLQEDNPRLPTHRSASLTDVRPDGCTKP